jgi:ribonuclease T1
MSNSVERGPRSEFGSNVRRLDSTWQKAVVALIAVVAVAAAWWWQHDRGQANQNPSATTQSVPGAVPVPPPPRNHPAPAQRPQKQTFPKSNAPIVDLAKISDEEERSAVSDMVDAIDAGGPFRYRKDGTVWQNREHRLPAKENGYYHEYTVDTPNSDDRGARRIIAGSHRELFYTRDHYRTFTTLRAASDQ